ncbi:hypothetical protein [Dyella caseinilytica]|uniref:LPP20 lipoprotein n=1 Tax=Dyella caseinilytica TaxID=1849581 RepID=A0ABX7GU83_9GAMM|nr:hypothetical protein [Dyella caseinilytica]QRN54008.1 hypothetical protein ISN74_00950 [Dyella caseinilytica]GFZ90857.1 hypothetical protein GCM10011408_07600 [Dyella caseinilytica]
MRFQILGRSLLVLAMFALVACHKKEDNVAVPGGDTPEAAVQQSVTLIKAGDFDGFWKHALPPADYANLRNDWKLPHPDRRPITDGDRARFTQAVQQITAPNAETTLYDQLKPKLAQLEAQYHDQLPVMIGIGQAILTTGIAQNKTMTETQKQQARDALNVLLPWAQQTPWFDQDKAKQAVGVVVVTARQLDLKSADQVQNMDFDTAMKNYSIGFGGVKQLLDIYGLSVDDALNSVKATTISMDHGQAHVKIDYTLLGKPLTTDSQLVLVDGRWYSQDLINSARAEHEQLLHPSAPASSASAPIPAASTQAPASASTTGNVMAAKP